MGDDFPAFYESLRTPAPVSIRLNPFKSSGQYEDNEKIPWSEDGRYLNERPSFTLDPLFHAGCYYVQEASSQFLEQAFSKAILNIDHPVVLDLCAAPGGKSTHLLSMLNGKGVLISNEIISARNNILRENLIKWGKENVIVTQNDAQAFARLQNAFDVIVIDAPCSGEGLFRRDPDASNEWSVDAVNNCAIRQSDILQNVISALKPGGFLVYSTCTFEQCENEEQVSWLIDHGFELMDINTYPGISTNGMGYAFYPHKIKGEGFFIALLRKTSGESNRSVRKPQSIKLHTPPKELEQYIELNDFSVEKKENRIWLYNHAVKEFMQRHTAGLYIRNAGLFAGEYMRNDWIPSHDVAMYGELKSDLAKVDLSQADALSYLRGEAGFSVTAEKGWHLVSFKSIPLGWIKVIPGRFNNYYPKEWRIRMR